jgi:hypothetical protein
MSNVTLLAYTIDTLMFLTGVMLFVYPVQLTVRRGVLIPFRESAALLSLLASSPLSCLQLAFSLQMPINFFAIIRDIKRKMKVQVRKIPVFL